MFSGPNPHLGVLPETRILPSSICSFSPFPFAFLLSSIQRDIYLPLLQPTITGASDPWLEDSFSFCNLSVAKEKKITPVPWLLEIFESSTCPGWFLSFLFSIAFDSVESPRHDHAQGEGNMGLSLVWFSMQSLLAVRLNGPLKTFQNSITNCFLKF